MWRAVLIASLADRRANDQQSPRVPVAAHLGAAGNSTTSRTVAILSNGIGCAPCAPCALCAPEYPALVAQWIEYLASDQGVGGSRPSEGITGKPRRRKEPPRPSWPGGCAVTSPRVIPGATVACRADRPAPVVSASPLAVGGAASSRHAAPHPPPASPQPLSNSARTGANASIPARSFGTSQICMWEMPPRA